MQRKRYGTRLVQFESLRKVKPANRHILFSTALQNAMYSGAIEPILSGKYPSAPGSQSRCRRALGNSAIAWSALPRHGALHLDRCSAISRLTTSHFGPASYWCPFAIANLSGVPLLCAERSPRGSPLVDNPLAAWVNGGTVNGLPDCARARCRRF